MASFVRQKPFCRVKLPHNHSIVMKITETNLAGAFVLEPKVFGDERGFFLESWNKDHYASLSLVGEFVQDNHSRSAGGVLRGMHYQIAKPQGKLVRVSKGEVFDVIVDLRRSSDTFGQWAGVTLSETNFKQLWVPPGFAHGFYVTSDSADFQYKCTEFYAPELERCLRWDDPAVGIEWPILEGVPPTVSDKDRDGTVFAALETFE